MGSIKLGVIGIINEEIKKDMWGALQRLADIGFNGIEGAPMQLLEGDAAANVKRFHGMGLEAVTMSVGNEVLSDAGKLDELIRNGHALNAPHATVWRLPTETRDETMRTTELLEAAGRRLAAEGIKLCYHNHEFEFVNIFNGVCALDLMAAYSDPKHLYFELDVAWSTFAGQTPAKLIKKMKERIAAVHVKDLYAPETWDFSYQGDKQMIFTALGTGVVNVREAAAAAIDAGIGWMVVEQDKPRNLTGFDILTLDYLYLKELGFVK